MNTNHLLLIYVWFVRTALFFLPDIPLIMRFRGFLYGLFMAKCGKNFQVTHDATVKELRYLHIGNNCFVGNRAFIMANGDIYIEDEVMFGPNSICISGNHTSLNGSYRYGPSDRGEITIKYGSWVAANSTLIKGAVLPANSVLAANSVLNKEFSCPNSIYGGIPARLIKTKS